MTTILNYVQNNAKTLSVDAFIHQIVKIITNAPKHIMIAAIISSSLEVS